MENEAMRKLRKQESRRIIDAAAVRICEAAQNMAVRDAKNMTPEELMQLAAALDHATAAMRGAEQYAESTPYAVGFCAE